MIPPENDQHQNVPESSSTAGIHIQNKRISKSYVWYMLGLSLAATTIRLGYQSQTAGVPFVQQLIGDAAGYYSWAGRIAGGDWFGKESFYQAPLYPYTLAVLFSLFGQSVAIARVAQAIWGGLSVLLLGMAAGRMFDRKVGIVSAILLALFPPAIFFDGIIQKASLGGALLCALLFVVSRNMPKADQPRGLNPAARDASRLYKVVLPAILGVLCALMSLTRENALVWIPIFVVWVALRGKRVRTKLVPIAAFLIGAATVLGGVAARNASVSGEWSLSTFQAGPNFYIGNHIDADGRYQPLVRGHETPTFERKDATLLAERDLGRTLSPREVSRYWFERTGDDIRTEPAAWVRLLWRKWLMVWNRYEVSDAESMHVYGVYFPAFGAAGDIFHFGILAPLAVIGFVATWDKRRELWLLYALVLSMALAVTAFFVLARYRYPLTILLIPFAAAGLLALANALRTRRWGTLRGPLIAGAVVVVLTNWPIHDEQRLDAMASMNAGVALAQNGETEGATVWFRHALEGFPESAEINNNLAMALALQEDYSSAIEHYRRARLAEPSLIGVAYNLGVALERVGRIDEAMIEYTKALRENPDDVEAAGAIERMSGDE